MNNISEKGLEANRRNAAKSTGPKTPEGKARVAHNRLLHGLRAWSDVVEGEDEQEYNRLQSSLAQELTPEGELENALVARVGSCLWRLWRIQRIEAGIMTREKAGALTRTIRPKLSADQILAEFAGTRPEMPATVEHDPESLAGWGLAWIRMCNAADGHAIDKLSRYEAGLERSMLKALHEYERIRARRRGESVPVPLAVDVSVDMGGSNGFER